MTPDRDPDPSAVGQTTSFRVGGRMVPFQVVRDCGAMLHIRSLDLLTVARIPRSSWDKQKQLMRGFVDEG